MYEFIENLDKEQFEQFVYNQKQAHFMQSSYWADVQKNKKFKAYYVGLKKNRKLVATALILEKKLIKNIGYMYSPRGFITDYHNKETLKEFTKHLKTFLKRHHNMFLRIDPCIEFQELDDEEKAKNKINNLEIINTLKELRFKHKGFNKNFENSQPRYTFRLDIDGEIDDIFKKFHPTTRKILNKGNQYNLIIHKGTKKDIEDFYLTMIETAKRENIIPSNISYYKHFYKILNQQNMSDIYIIKANIDDLKTTYQFLINQIEEEITRIENNEKKNAKKGSNLINDLNSKIKKMKQELEEINEIHEKEIVLSSIITAKYKDKVWTVHGGNHNLLRWLNANYLLYYEIIKDAKKDGFKIVDFFGTTGNPNPDNPIYGIHLFKKRFGGKYIEFIGEFDLINQKLLYFLYNKYINYKKKRSH